MSTYGRAQSDWDAAKAEARDILIQISKKRNPIVTYSDLANALNMKFDVRFGPHDPVFWEFLDQISKDENALGGSLLSVFVVDKINEKPGQGFYKMARSLGRKGKDDVELWLLERAKAIEYCSRI